MIFAVSFWMKKSFLLLGPQSQLLFLLSLCYSSSDLLLPNTLMLFSFLLSAFLCTSRSCFLSTWLVAPPWLPYVCSLFVPIYLLQCNSFCGFFWHSQKTAIMPGELMPADAGGAQKAVSAMRGREGVTPCSECGHIQICSHVPGREAGMLVDGNTM